MAKYAPMDNNLLAMALVGYEQEKTRIEAAIANIHTQLGRATPALSVSGDTIPRKRILSAAARRRIALAQKKRWAAQRQAKAEAVRPKRKMSAAGRAAIVAATKKRWAAFHKAQAEAEKKAAARAKARKASPKAKPAAKTATQGVATT